MRSRYFSVSTSVLVADGLADGVDEVVHVRRQLLLAGSRHHLAAARSTRPAGAPPRRGDRRHKTLLYCHVLGTALYCALYCTVLCCKLLNCIVLFNTVLFRTWRVEGLGFLSPRDRIRDDRGQHALPSLRTSSPMARLAICGGEGRKVSKKGGERVC